MFSVVLVHVLTYSFGLDPFVSGLCILRTTFTLPLFFFVSGFFLFRPIQRWTRPKVKGALKVRSIALLGGTMVVTTLYFAAKKDCEPLQWLPDGNFIQYWYTISLFQLFIYYLASVGVAKLLKREWIVWVIMGALTIASFLIVTFNDDVFWVNWFCSKKTMFYLPFFVMGLCVRRWQKEFLGLISRPITLTVLIVIFLGSVGAGFVKYDFLENFSKPLLNIDRDIISKFAGSLLVITIFYTYREYFDKETRFVRAWRQVGKRTLDIYFIHYFLIPSLPGLKVYMIKNSTFLTELTAGAVVALLILTVTMGISAILRRAPLIRNLLGAKGPIEPYSPGK